MELYATCLNMAKEKVEESVKMVNPQALIGLVASSQTDKENLRVSDL